LLIPVGMNWQFGRRNNLFQPEAADVILAPRCISDPPVRYGLRVGAKAKTVPASDPVMTAPFATVGDAYWKPVSVV